MHSSPVDKNRNLFMLRITMSRCAPTEQDLLRREKFGLGLCWPARRLSKLAWRVESVRERIRFAKAFACLKRFMVCELDLGDLWCLGQGLAVGQRRQSGRASVSGAQVLV